MTRKEHLQWCKDRANRYLNMGDVANGITSMLSDMDKHEETKMPDALSMLGMMITMKGDLSEAKKFVDGFN